MSKTSIDASRAPPTAALAYAALLSLGLTACARPGVASSASSSRPQDASADSQDASSSAPLDAGGGQTATDIDAGGGQAATDPLPDAGPANAGAPAVRSSEPLRALDAKIRAVASGDPRALVRGGANEDVSPESRFEIDLPRLANFRVRLLDEADRAVASTDRAEVADRLRYQLTPVEALAPGSPYALVIDGLKSELAADDQGRAYEALRVGLKTSGEKPPKPDLKRGKAGKPHKSAR